MKLGEVISKAITVKCKERVLPVLSITMRDGFVLQSDKFKKEIASKDKSSYNVVKRNQLVQSIHIDEGGFAVQTLVDEGIVSPAYRIWDVDTSKVDGEYLSTILRSPRSIAFYKSKLRGSIQRRGKIDDADILGMDIPVPSILEQYQILDELHLLSGIIDKQKAQLKELDTLAQSIFYDMFGDPIENEKGWDISKLEDVSTLINGRAYKQDELLSEGKYKVLRVGNFFTNDNYYYSNLELEEEKYCYCGDLLFAWSASFGAFIWTENKTIFHYHIWRILYDKEKLNIHYYRFLLNAMTSYFMKDVHGIGMVHLTKAGMEQYDLPIPPLRIQQSFAQKIQSIESQKASINRSIAETQKLFDYTMDKYFG